MPNFQPTRKGKPAPGSLRPENFAEIAHEKTADEWAEHFGVTAESVKGWERRTGARCKPRKPTDRRKKTTRFDSAPNFGTPGLRYYGQGMVVREPSYWERKGLEMLGE